MSEETTVFLIGMALIMSCLPAPIVIVCGLGLIVIAVFFGNKKHKAER